VDGDQIVTTHINLALRQLFTNVSKVLNIMEEKTFTYIMALQSCSEQIYVTAYYNQSLRSTE
jgi:hypothetical protein